MQWVSLRCPDGFTLKTATTNEEARVFYEKMGLVQVGSSINDFNGKEEVEYAAFTSRAEGPLT